MLSRLSEAVCVRDRETDTERGKEREKEKDTDSQDTCPILSTDYAWMKLS